MLCDWLLPTHGHYFTPDNEMVSCLLKKGHADDHLSRVPDGEYILWSPDYRCDCSEEDCGCFVSVGISPEEATQLIQGGIMG